MTQKELEQKVIDAEGRVAKREAVLKKHNSQLAKMIGKGADRFDISIKREDIKSATSKLAEARETLANWQEMLVRLFAGEIIMGRITEDDVPAKLKARVHKYLVDMGYFDDVEE